MRLGIEKCATIVLKTGKKETDDGILLHDGEMMKDLGDEGYKYLGVLDASKKKTWEMKEKVRSVYRRRVKLLLESKLNRVLLGQSKHGSLLC